MGEYYRWVNVDKKEYLCPSDFDYGSKLHESMHKRNAVLCALRELLSSDWKNDRVFFKLHCIFPLSVLILTKLVKCFICYHT